MEIFGVGPSELLFIILIAIIVLGPKDMQKAGKSIGRFLNQLVRSDSWKVFQKTSTEIRNLPRNLMREANMEVAEAEKELRHTLDPRLEPSDPRVIPGPGMPPSDTAEMPVQTTEPPAAETTPTQDNTDEHD